MPARTPRRRPPPEAWPRADAPERAAQPPRAGARTDAPAPTLDEQRSRLFDFTRGLHATHLLALGQETGALQQIGNAGAHGLSVPELADRTGWTPEYAQLFLEAAFALGILELASQAGVTPRARYRFAPHMAELLSDETRPLYMGSVPRYHALLAREYGRYAELFRTGKTFPYALHGEEFLRTAVTSTRALPARFLADVLPRLPPLRRRLETGAHVLDVGCGAGWALVRLAEEFPKCRLVGVDAEPNAIEMAKTLVAFRQLGARVEARLVRGEEIDYEAEFDVVTLFLVLRSIPPRQKAPALAHATRALKRGGHLLLLDEAYPDAPAAFRDPDGQRNVLTQWIEGPWGHHLSTRVEHRALVAGAGLRVLQEIDAGPYYVVLAERS